MKKYTKPAATLIMVVALFALNIFIWYTQFANPDMTETRLFLTYWKQYLGMSAIFLVSAAVREM